MNLGLSARERVASDFGEWDGINQFGSVLLMWIVGLIVSWQLALASPGLGGLHFIAGAVWELIAWISSLDNGNPPPLRTTPSGIILLGIGQLGKKLSERRLVSSALYSDWMEFVDSNRYRRGALERISDVQEAISRWEGPRDLLLQLNEASRRLQSLSDQARVFKDGYSTESTWSEVFRQGRDRRLREADLYRWAFQVESLISPVESFIQIVGTAPPEEPAGIGFGSTGTELVRFWNKSKDWNRAVKCLRRELPKPRRIRGRFRCFLTHHV